MSTTVDGLTQPRATWHAAALNPDDGTHAAPTALFDEPKSRTSFLNALDNPRYDERVYNGAHGFRGAVSGAPCEPMPLPYLPEDDGLPCLELLLSGVFIPGCTTAPACPFAPLPEPRVAAQPKRRAAAPKRSRATNPVKAAGKARRTKKTHKRERTRGDVKSRTRSKNVDGADNTLPFVFQPDVVERAADECSDTSLSHQSLPPAESGDGEDNDRGDHKSAANRDDANDMNAMRAGFVRVLPCSAMSLPVTWHHAPIMAPREPPAMRFYQRAAAAGALISLCHAVNVDVPADASLEHAVDAVASVTRALADALRPHDPKAVTCAGWAALMGNYDPSPSATQISPLWAGRTTSLASAGLRVVAPAPFPEDVTPEQRALRVLSIEAHMPWFATRARAVAHETLMGAPSRLGYGLFDVLPVDTFLVLNLDAAGVARPYDIYVVPRIDILLSRLST